MSRAQDRQKEQERAEHNKTYSSLSARDLAPRTPADYEREVATPTKADHGVLAGDVNRHFLDRIHRALAAYPRDSVSILDYGCGMGKMSVYLAQLGYQDVQGFDLSDEGVFFGERLAQVNDVAEQVSLKQMDAANLAYPDDTFDIVIGKAVLHHTIKYQRTAEELRRVMRPGAVAIFKENIGNNPIMRAARYVTMDLRGHHGDVNITSAMLRDYARDFTSVDVEAFHLFFMTKRLLWKPGMQPRWRKATMSALQKLDEATIHRSARLRLVLGGEAIITLVK